MLSDVDSGFSVSGTSSMSSAQDLRHSHLSHGDQRSRGNSCSLLMIMPFIIFTLFNSLMVGGSTNSRYQDYNESE